MTRYKCANAIAPLTQGQTYEATHDGRHTVLKDIATGQAFHMYPWEIAHGTARGALVVVPGCQSEAMDCPTGDALLAHTQNGFAY